MNAVDELIAFLRAQLDEDERVARAADSGRWLPEDKGITFEYRADDFHGGEAQARLVADTRANQWHIANWDPPRVLAEVEAKRRVLELHVGEHDCPEMQTGTYSADWPKDAPWGKAGEHWAHASTEHFESDQPCPTVRQIAQPYAGREGWREEWAL